MHLPGVQVPAHVLHLCWETTRVCLRWKGGQSITVSSALLKVEDGGGGGSGCGALLHPDWLGVITHSLRCPRLPTPAQSLDCVRAWWCAD